MSKIDNAVNQKMAAHEAAWRRAERDIIRRERVRLFRAGVIRSAGIPQLMVKDADDRWWPNANFVKGDVS